MALLELRLAERDAHAAASLEELRAAELRGEGRETRLGLLQRQIATRADEVRLRDERLGLIHARLASTTEQLDAKAEEARAVLRELGLAREMHMQMQMQMQMQIRMQIRIRIRMHIHVHTHTHIHMHIRIQRRYILACSSLPIERETGSHSNQHVPTYVQAREAARMERLAADAMRQQAAVARAQVQARDEQRATMERRLLLARESVQVQADSQADRRTGRQAVADCTPHPAPRASPSQLWPWPRVPTGAAGHARGGGDGRQPQAELEGS